MKTNNTLLLFAGVFSFCAAVFQLVISCVPRWSAFFGAGETLVSNPPLLLAAGLGVTILLALWGFYGFSGAGLIRRLPLLRLGIMLIGAVYIFRGLPVIFLLLARIKILLPIGDMEIQNLLVTLGSLTAGLFYWVGLILGWKKLGLKATPGRILPSI
jgi:putative oxidoreductase